nr:uncharacterized protein LOC116651592 [Drosophila virilis]
MVMNELLLSSVMCCVIYGHSQRCSRIAQIELQQAAARRDKKQKQKRAGPGRKFKCPGDQWSAPRPSQTNQFRSGQPCAPKKWQQQQQQRQRQQVVHEAQDKGRDSTKIRQRSMTSKRNVAHPVPPLPSPTPSLLPPPNVAATSQQITACCWATSKCCCCCCLGLLLGRSLSLLLLYGWLSLTLV